MKKIIFLILMLSINITNSQITKKERDSILFKNFKVKLSEKLAQYDDSIINDKGELIKNKGVIQIQPTLLNSKIDTLFRSVVLSGSNIMNNTSSFGFSLGEKNTNISTSLNIPLSEPDANQYFANIGLFLEGKGSKYFNLYTEDSWANNLGFNLGFKWKFRGGGKFLNKNKERKYVKIRRYYADSILNKMKTYSSKRIDTVTTYIFFLDKIVDYNLKSNITEKISSNETYELLHREIKGKQKKNTVAIGKEKYRWLLRRVKEKGANNVYDSLKKQENDFKLYSEKKYEKKIVKDFFSFDNSTVKQTGYYFSWIDINFEGSNATYEIDSLNLLPKSSDFEKFKTKFRYKTTINYNHMSDGNVMFWYLQAGLYFKNGNFLDNNLIKNKPRISKKDNELIVEDIEGNKIGAYADLGEERNYAGINLYFNSFFAKNKQLGFSVDFKHDYRMESYSDNPYFQNNFTFLVGPIFRDLRKKGVSKGSYGIELGFENVPYGKKINQDFIARIRIGLPFNAVFK